MSYSFKQVSEGTLYGEGDHFSKSLKEMRESATQASGARAVLAEQIAVPKPE